MSRAGVHHTKSNQRPNDQHYRADGDGDPDRRIQYLSHQRCLRHEWINVPPTSSPAHIHQNQSGITFLLPVSRPAASYPASSSHHRKKRKPPDPYPAQHHVTSVSEQ